MILTALSRALGQIGDSTFRRVLILGLGLTVLLLAGLGWLTVTGIGWLLPETMSLPWIGEIAWVDDAASVAGILLVLVLSVVLMVPVASVFTGFFLDDVADAVEAKHYPHLPPADRIAWSTQIADAAGFLALVVGVNLAGLIVYLLVAPAAPFVFWAVNGFLLGREYFQMVAIRRLGRQGARAARRRHGGTIWLAGTLMALPLTIPVVNLTVPVLGAAVFTHLFHLLESGPSGRTSRNRAR
ncbi:EI24 domain-containing protein [Tranquillimonas alkanivorans]|uniref:Uncharacterized protein involved in cysteine biosynthesis n=1 Tax=Tranquillimonas alkanivorans TaxID=441119 RepID=A0A1I5TEG3_9RHOB|nr:EI24 domain-containing protein [Tranquillimonas alkanivorans]SFP81433.1 Uncharacterized protein involved in cysteine biosynthesis [Tranquillimonas alkanivorans]